MKKIKIIAFILSMTIIFLTFGEAIAGQSDFVIKSKEAIAAKLSNQLQNKNLLGEIYGQIVSQPMNLFILGVGLLTLLINCYCWLIASRRKWEISSKAKEYVEDKSNFVTTAAVHLLTEIPPDTFLRRFTKLSGFIESVFREKLNQKNNSILGRNIYFALVDILPLLGICGTLWAIAEQAFQSGGINPEQIKGSLGLAIISTLLALFFTILNKIFEGFWLHSVEFVESFKEFISMYTMKNDSSIRPEDTSNKSADGEQIAENKNLFTEPGAAEVKAAIEEANPAK